LKPFLRLAVLALRPVFLPLLVSFAAAGWPGQLPSLAAQGQAQGVDRVVISIGNQKMTAGDVEKFIQALPPAYRAFYGGAGRHLLPQLIVRMKILANEARHKNLEQNPDVQRAIQTAVDSILADAAERSIKQGITVSPDEIQSTYEARKAQFEEVHLRLIFIRGKTSGAAPSADTKPAAVPEDKSQKELEEIRERILGGADFSAMARSYSQDKATASKGGDVGYIPLSGMSPALAGAVNSLALGQVSNVIPTSNGYELVQVIDKRTEPLDDVKSSIESQIKEQKFEAILRDLEQKDSVQIDTDFFAGPPSAEPSSAKP
jgi:PPIC-type PPIASE domain